MAETSRRKTVLFFPLNSPGHINSSLGIADVLKRELNYRTVFLLLGASIGTSIENHGHELVTLKEVSPLEDFEIEDGEDTSVLVDEAAKLKAGKKKRKFEGVLKWPQLIRRYDHLFKLEPLEAFVSNAEIMEKCMVVEMIENHDNYAKAIAEINPDLLIIDAYYVPPCVVKSKTPWVRLYSANPLILTKSKLANNLKPAPMVGFQLFNKEKRRQIQAENPQQWESILKEWQDANNRIVGAIHKAECTLADFLEKSGCEPLPAGKQAHESPYLNIYMYPEALDYEQDDDLLEYPKMWVRCDSMMRQKADAGSAEDKDLREWQEKLEVAAQGKEAIVFFSLGSLASGNLATMKRFVNMLSKATNKLFVISKGVNGDKLELNEQNMIGANYIPQQLFLERADLAIIHGGNNSVTECMYYGKPMLVLPVFHDQVDNAQRIEDLGFGRRLHVDRCTQDELLRTVDELIRDQKLKEKMRLVGEQMRSRNDLKKIIKALDTIATRGLLTEEEFEGCRTKLLS